MAHILIIGGHGKVALRTYAHLLERGHSVTGMIRNADQSGSLHDSGASALVADIERLEAPELTRLFAEFDVIVWSAGAGGGNPERTYAVDRDAAIRSMVAAEQAGVKRYIMVSYLGSRLDHGIDPEQSFFHYAEAKAAADEYLRSTTLDWTILAPGALTLEPVTGNIEVVSPEDGSVSRDNVALVVAHTVDTDTLIGKTVRFNDGDTPIAEALGAIS